MSEQTDNPKSLTGFAVLMALCAASHESVHLAQATLTASWVLGAGVFLGAMWLLYRPTLQSLLILALLQISSVAVDAPYNPDHWLLVLFVNLLLLGTALRIRWHGRKLTPSLLMENFAPGARLVFLFCYGFAALSKYNIDFLFSDNSVARKLLELQAREIPALSWLVWPPAVPWLTLFCETAVPLCLLFQRTRVWGILVGLLFHAALMISPSVAVYDFTLAVYMMLYLFTPNGLDVNVRSWLRETRDNAPELATYFRKYRPWLSLAPAVAFLTVSAQMSMESLTTRLAWLRWMVAMLIVISVILVGCIGLFSRTRGRAALRWMPRWGLPYAIIGLAIMNGLCPYLGLKTQGSFTMFSNLRTEAGEWNHLFMPESLRIVDHYQDRLVQITATDDPVLQKQYVERGLLATEFEVRRRVAEKPALSLTVRRGAREIVVDVAEDPVLGTPPDLLAQKLLIFRPVSMDGEPFVTN